MFRSTAFTKSLTPAGALFIRGTVRAEADTTAFCLTMAKGGTFSTKPTLIAGLALVPLLARHAVASFAQITVVKMFATLFIFIAAAITEVPPTYVAPEVLQAIPFVGPTKNVDTVSARCIAQAALGSGLISVQKAAKVS